MRSIADRRGIDQQGRSFESCIDRRGSGRVLSPAVRNPRCDLGNSSCDPSIPNPKSESGQSTVEMALLLPIFLIFIFSIIEIGRAWAAKQAITNAAREGARILVLPYGSGFSPYPNADVVREAAIQTAKDYMASAGLDTSESVTAISLIKEVSGSIQDNSTGEMVRGDKVGVRISYKFDTPLPVLLLSGSSPINLGASSLMEHE